MLAAQNAGYTVLNYDRIGNGQSQKANAYTVVQAPLEVEILQVLTSMVHHGTLLSAASPPSTPNLHLPPFKSVVHVGHSYGSQTTAAFLKKYGSQSAGAILTGFAYSNETNAHAANFGFEYAASNNPSLWGDLPSGYIVTANPYGAAKLLPAPRQRLRPCRFL